MTTYATCCIDGGICPGGGLGGLGWLGWVGGAANHILLHLQTPVILRYSCVSSSCKHQGWRLGWVLGNVLLQSQTDASLVGTQVMLGLRLFSSSQLRLLCGSYLFNLFFEWANLSLAVWLAPRFGTRRWVDGLTALYIHENLEIDIMVDAFVRYVAFVPKQSLCRYCLHCLLDWERPRIKAKNLAIAWKGFQHACWCAKDLNLW